MCRKQNGIILLTEITPGLRLSVRTWSVFPQQERKRIGSDKTALKWLRKQQQQKPTTKHTTTKNRTGPLPVKVMWPSSRTFKSDHFRKNGRGPTVVDQNLAGGKMQLGQLCECRGRTVQTGRFRVASKQSQPGQRWKHWFRSLLINQNWRRQNHGRAWPVSIKSWCKSYER